MADCVDHQAMLCNAGLGPEMIVMREYASHADYAYHLDVRKCAMLLRDHAIGMLGMEHVLVDAAFTRFWIASQRRTEAARLAHVRSQVWVPSGGTGGLLVRPLSSMCPMSLVPDAARRRRWARAALG
ncbi:hypothetical protein ACQKJZ_12055 [Sphingomonas sp. NPDC019816]|uniref:hypothetical protein n=1 Tax=Sphingomonas sp. NPDC019816 TaxID=3390679 RepID=UPI003D094CB4